MSSTARPRPVTPVGILADRLTGIRHRLAELGTVDADLLDEVGVACELAAGLEPYLDACTTPESPALAELDRRTRAQDWSQHDGSFVEQEMLSGHLEGQLLGFLVGLTGAQQVLEIGMFTGYASLAMAQALPAGGRVVALEIDPAVADFALQCFKESLAGEKISVRVGPALETLTELAAAGERFDLVFLDADKGGYLAYLDTLLSTELLAPGALVCVDNTLLQGEPWAGTPSTNGAAIADFNRAVVADNRVEQVLVPLRDGLTLIRRVRAT